ncbi:MAG: TetR/AcrR family transcriptional regulator [bacterium]|nr:TetR/AcrR family transcriptional regulator [bacterium]
MRIRDDKKYEAISNAAIALINSEGFAATSMSKIAKKAGVSPATIYIYFENKEDLLIKTYMMVKKAFADAILEGIDLNQPVNTVFRTVWFRYYDVINQHLDDFIFTEQFSNSPIVDRIDHEEIESYFKPLIYLIEQGQQENLIKEMPFDMIVACAFFPVVFLIKSSCKGNFELNKENLELVYQAAWDAIKKE